MFTTQQKKIIEHAYTTVPFYMSLARERNLNYKEFRDWEDIPVVRKQDLVFHTDSFISTNYISQYLSGELLCTHTSGSAGDCKNIYWNKEDMNRSLSTLWLRRRLCAIVLTCALSLYSPTYTLLGGAKKKEPKKNYLVQAKTISGVRSIKRTYAKSKLTNDNGEDRMEEDKLVAVRLTEKEYQKLSKKSNVTLIEKDAIVKGSSQKSIHLNKVHRKKTTKIKKNMSDNEWNLRMIHADNLTFTKEEVKKLKQDKVKVAVLDSGVDYGNDIELASSVSLIPGEEEMSPLFMDGSGHGNSVAGLIAAKENEEGITGVNPNVEIHSIRVLDDNNEAPLSRVIEGIYLAIDWNVNIINMSFGLDSYSEALEQAIQAASDAGILVVAAAGNTGDNGVQYPAEYEEVMAVGSVDQTGEVVESSAKGEEIEVVAPGEMVRSTGILPTVELVESGTSLAAPQVTGVASLIWAKDMTEPADFVRYVIQRSANAYGDFDAYGNGLLDAEYALQNYDELKADYYSENREQGVSSNQKEVLSFEDTGCVEGSWTRNDHGQMVASVGTYNNVKKGARFPDVEVSPYYNEETDTCTFARISQNPWWHGTYQQNTNYVATYIYETRVANNMLNYDKKEVTASAPNGLSNAQKRAINSDVHSIKWENEYDKEPSAGTKRAFVWGMAIHNLADAFAHSAYVYDKVHGVYEHLQHDKNTVYCCADDKSQFSPRYDNAAEAVKKSIGRYINRENNEYKSGSYQEYDTIKYNRNVYILRELSQNINAVTFGSVGTTYDYYTYTVGATEAYAQSLIQQNQANLIPGSARPYK